MKRLWINGRASEDREEWMEEVKAHCERCYDDKDETSQMQEERIQEQRHRGDCLEAGTGQKVQITVDRVLRARPKMMKNKANGPSDCWLAEMSQELPMESVYEIASWFEKKSTENVEPQRHGQFYVWYSSRSLMRSWRGEPEGFGLLL